MNKDNTVEKNEKTLNYAIYIPPPLPTQRDTSVPWCALQLKIIFPLAIYFVNKKHIYMVFLRISLFLEIFPTTNRTFIPTFPNHKVFQQPQFRSIRLERWNMLVLEQKCGGCKKKLNLSSGEKKKCIRVMATSELCCKVMLDLS